MKIFPLEILCIIIVATLISFPLFFLTTSQSPHPANRATINNQLQSLASQVIQNTAVYKGKLFTQTITPIPKDNSFLLGGNITLFDKKSSHPYGGKYFLYLQNSDGTFKERLDSYTKIAMEISDPSKSDGLVAVAYADGHVETIEYSKIDFTNFDPKEFLSIKGLLNP